MTPAAHPHDTTPRRGPGRHALPLFIVCSVAMHVFMLANWTPSAPQVSSGGVTLTVALSRPAPVPELKSDAPAPAVAEPPRRKDTARRMSRVSPAQDSAVSDAVEKSEPSPSPAGAASLRQAMEIDSDPTLNIAARVNLELARHFHYPAQAVRRGWQGTVTLGFRVSVDGVIENLHIAQSSGYALLDRAALGALGKVHAIALDSGTLRAALDLQLPVIYRLEES